MRALNALLLLLIFSYLYCAESSTIDYQSYQKGMQYYSEKKFLMAVGSFKKAMDSGYQDPKLYLYLANSYVANEDFDKAVDLYKLDLEMSDLPDLKATINFNLAYTFYLKKEYTKSIGFFNNAYVLNNNLNQTFWLKGNAYYLLKDKINTIKEWENYIEKVPKGKESDNIRNALSILKSTNYDMSKDKFLLSLNENSSNSNESGQELNKSQAIDVQPLIDIEGVLDEIKPSDKGKVADEGMEQIEN